LKTLKIIQAKNKVYYSSGRIYALLLFVLVFNKINAQLIDSLIYNQPFKRFKKHLTHDKENTPVLISQDAYIELDSLYSFKNNSNLIQPVKGLDFSKCHSVNVGSHLYLVSPDGSTVFRVEKEIGIRQLNFPNTTKSYFGCSIFTYGGSIYRLGGYGYWNSKSQLFKFNFAHKKWVYITSVLKNNFGFLGPKSIVVDNKVHVISRKIRNNFNNKESLNNYIYTIDLDQYYIEKYKFDFDKFSPYFNRLFSSTNYFKFKNNLGLINKYDHTKALIIDFKKKSSRLVNLSNTVFSRSKIIIQGKKLYFTTSFLGASNNLDEIGNQVYLANSQIINTSKNQPFKTKGYSNEIALLVLAALIFSIIYFKRKRKPFLLEKKLIKKGKNSIKLDTDEHYFVEYMIKNGKIENNVLISYFDNDGKSYDLNVKRKNSMISKLSLKFYSQFKKQLFEKVPSNIDKRQSIFKLKQKLILASKKS